MSSELLYQIGIVTIFSAVIGLVIKIFKQPLLLAFIIAGFIIGPQYLNFISDNETIVTISELGITFMLFIVGLDFNIKNIKETSKAVLVSGIAHLVFIFGAGFLIFKLLGFESIESAYIGLILSLSSTLLVVKLLSDNNEVGTIHGRITIGILVFQDIIAILALSLLAETIEFDFVSIGTALAGGMILIGTAFLVGKLLLKPLFDYAAKYPELLFIFSIAVVFAFSFFAKSLGLSIAIGAFIAGIIIANMPYSYELIGKIKPLSNFFNALFFVGLGMQIIPSIGNMVVPLLIMLGICLILKPIVIMFANVFSGYDAKTSFISAFHLGQVSEFSLILAAQGLLVNHFSKEMFSLTIIVTVLSMIISSYAVKYREHVYHIFQRPLKFCERKVKKNEDENADGYLRAEIIINGYKNLDTELLDNFRNHKKNFIVVDNDPVVINNLKSNSVNCLFGDLGEPEIIEKVSLHTAEIIISTVSDINTNYFLIQKVREVNKKAVVIVTANSVKDSVSLYKIGADYVILPSLITEKYVAVLFEDFSKDLNSIITKKLNHLEELKKKQIEMNSVYQDMIKITEIDDIMKRFSKKTQSNEEVAETKEDKQIKDTITKDVKEIGNQEIVSEPKPEIPVIEVQIGNQAEKKN